MDFYTLEHFYDFIYEKHGAETEETLRKLVADYVSEETQKLKENIDIYSCGFSQALHCIDEYEMKKGKLEYLIDDAICKAERLDKKIYKYFNNPDYYAEV